MNALIRVSLFSLTSTLLSPSVDAQEDTERMTVYASRSHDAIGETPASVTVLERKDLEQLELPGQSVGTLLGKTLPGFGMATQSVSNFGQTMRGRDVLILIDGIPQVENRQVSRQLNNIKAETIERIEVISGANAIYGSGAPGGIINIVTRGFSPEALSLETSVGTSVAAHPISYASQTYNLQQIVSGTEGAFQYLTSVGGEWRNNNYDAQGRLIPPEPAQTSRGDSDTYDALLKMRYHLTPRSFSEFSLETFDEAQKTDYVVQLNPYRAEPGLSLDAQPASKRRQYALRYENSDFLKQKLSLLAYHRTRELSFYPFALTAPVPLVNQSHSEAETSGFKASVQSPLPFQAELTWGLDLERNRGRERARRYDQGLYTASGRKVFALPSADYDYGPAVDTTTTGFFAQLKKTFDDSVHGKLGLRYEKIEQTIHDFVPPLETAIASYWPTLYAGIAQREAAGRLPAGTTARLPATFTPQTFTGGSRDYDAWAANLGFTYDLTPRHLAFFNFSQGYELADAARLMRDALAPESLIPQISPLFGLSLNAAHLDELKLQVVKTSSYEAGWRGSFDRAFADLTLFYNESDKAYVFNPDFSVDLLKRKKRIYGGESSLSYRATDALTLGVSHARAKGEARRSDGHGWAALSGLEVAPPKSALTVDYAYDSRLRLALQAQHSAAYGGEDDENPRDKRPALDLSEYLTVDTQLNYAFSDATSLKFAVSNALNRRYQTLFHQWAQYTYGEASGAPADGRRFSVVLRMLY